MAADKAILASLIKQEYQSRMMAAFDHDPYSMEITKYLEAFVEGLAGGIAKGSSTLQFNTLDNGAGGFPDVGGVGTSTKIIVDADDMAERFYTNIFNATAKFGETAHEPWPPSSENSGAKLKVICEAISNAIKIHFDSCWTLTSAHPFVYQGVGIVSGGMFFGLDPNIIGKGIQASAPILKGPFWPDFTVSIATGYVSSIHQKATASQAIVGSCSSSKSQVCGIPMVGKAGIGAVS